MVHKRWHSKKEKKHWEIYMYLFIYGCYTFYLKYRCTESCKYNINSPKNHSLTFSQW